MVSLIKIAGAGERAAFLPYGIQQRCRRLAPDRRAISIYNDEGLSRCSSGLAVTETCLSTPMIERLSPMSAMPRDDSDFGDPFRAAAALSHQL
jgi:hypothetical protein